MLAGFQRGLSISKLAKVEATVTMCVVISQPSHRRLTKYRIKYFSFLGAELRLQGGSSGFSWISFLKKECKQSSCFTAKSFFQFKKWGKRKVIDRSIYDGRFSFVIRFAVVVRSSSVISPWAFDGDGQIVVAKAVKRQSDDTRFKSVKCPRNFKVVVVLINLCVFVGGACL